jgi:hypothetical protein
MYTQEGFRHRGGRDKIVTLNLRIMKIRPYVRRLFEKHWDWNKWKSKHYATRMKSNFGIK